jgi:hypothetical protein
MSSSGDERFPVHRAPPEPEAELHAALDGFLAVSPPRPAPGSRSSLSGWRQGAKLACTLPLPGVINVAIRSVRHLRAVPPRRRMTPSMASMRWTVRQSVAQEQKAAERERVRGDHDPPSFVGAERRAAVGRERDVHDRRRPLSTPPLVAISARLLTNC